MKTIVCRGHRVFLRLDMVDRHATHHFVPWKANKRRGLQNIVDKNERTKTSVELLLVPITFTFEGIVRTEAWANVSEKLSVPLQWRTRYYASFFHVSPAASQVYMLLMMFTSFRMQESRRSTSLFRFHNPSSRFADYTSLQSQTFIFSPCIYDEVYWAMMTNWKITSIFDLNFLDTSAALLSRIPLKRQSSVQLPH